MKAKYVFLTISTTRMTYKGSQLTNYSHFKDALKKKKERLG